MTVTLNTLPEEVLYYTFGFCTRKTNIVTNALVCKSWRYLADEVAKKQMLDDIECKAANFLKLVPEKLEFYCASYAALKNSKFQDYTAKQVHEVIEKHTVCIACFFRVAPQSNISKDLLGKVFVELHKVNHEAGVCMWTGSKADDKIKSWYRYFPVELFDLTVGKEDTIEGNKDKGSVYFVLKGRLIALTLTKGSKEELSSRFSSSTLERDKVLPFEVKNAQNINFRIREDHLYVADRDALPPPQSDHQTASKN